jgi:indolepyruvate ferredoxin oxidoreductase beta subunit
MVMVGAASASLPIDQEILEESISDIFKRKGDHVVEVNLKAFRLGRS